MGRAILAKVRFFALTVAIGVALGLGAVRESCARELEDQPAGRGQLATCCDLPHVGTEGSAARVHLALLRPSGGLYLVERVDTARRRSVTALSFFRPSGSGIALRVDGITGEIAIYSAKGSVSVLPLHGEKWLACAVDAAGSVTVEETGPWETFSLGAGMSSHLAAALASALDMEALHDLLNFMGAEGFPFPPGMNYQPADFWDCLRATSAALLAAAGVAASCGTPGVNAIACGGAIASYLVALQDVARACDAAHW